MTDTQKKMLRIFDIISELSDLQELEDRLLETAQCMTMPEGKNVPTLEVQRINFAHKHRLLMDEISDFAHKHRTLMDELNTLMASLPVAELDEESKP